MRRFALLLVLAAMAGAQDAPYGDTYTPAELAALDRALHAGNLDRRDLAFEKALTDGHGALPLVREMLRDPLRIAPGMDGIVARQARLAERASPAVAALIEGATLLAKSEGGPPEPPADFLLSVVTEPEVPATPEAALDLLARIVAAQPRLAPGGDDPELVLDVLRARLPAEMAWHEVFPSPFDGERQAAIDAWRKDEPAALHEAAARIDAMDLARDWLMAFGDPARWLPRLPAAAFPADRPLERDTPYGRIALGTPKADVWDGEYAAVIDPGGDDRYVRCRIGAAPGTAGRRVGFFADLAGDDTYECGDVDLTMGAAVLGIAGFFDLGAGNDRYVAGHASLGAAMGGVAVFLDDGGSDVYEGRTYTQGAAGFGVAVLLDDSVQERPVTTSDEGTKDPVDIRLFDNDRLSAWANAQAFARPCGVAFCINRRGNEVYEAGGVYLHAPLFADRYQSFSQGFSIGSRGIDWAGGIAMIIDHDGNDRYLGDIYNQGVGYWYGAGLLWDGGGNDTYEMTQYGQGSGIHLAVGGLVDVSGHDTYVMHSGLGQGGSHDYAASVLHDRGGNDRYHGSTSCNGCGLTNAVGLQIDRAGDDTYGARKSGGVNCGRPARDFPSIGVLVDLAGADDYLGVMGDGQVWRHTDVGVGVDLTVPDGEGPAGGGAAPGEVHGTAEIPAVCSHEGELTPEVFDQLWEIAVRWEVGDNRYIVPAARKRLVAFGAAILPLLDGKVETDNSGLELRAFVDVLRGLPREPVLDFLRRNATAESARRRQVALHLIGELKAAEAGDAVAALLEGEDAGLARRAAGVLAALGSHAGDATLAGWLGSGDGRKTAAAVSALLALEADVYPALRPLLAAEDFAVRGRVVTLLAAHLPEYADALRADLAAPGLAVRARRSVLDILARAEWTPAAADAAALAALMDHQDWGVRGDAARVIRRLESQEAMRPAVEALERRLSGETEPYVKSAAGE